MAISTSNNEDIIPFISYIELLGEDAEPSGQTAISPIWFRCFIEFSNINGEDVIDIKVINSLSDDDHFFINDRVVYTNTLNLSIIKKYLDSVLLSFKDKSSDIVFSRIASLGYLA